MLFLLLQEKSVVMANTEAMMVPVIVTDNLLCMILFLMNDPLAGYKSEQAFQELDKCKLFYLERETAGR
jgi:hypothetical protein